MEHSTAIGKPHDQRLSTVVAKIEPFLPTAKKSRKEILRLVAKAELSLEEVNRVRSLCETGSGRLRKVLNAISEYKDMDKVEQYFAAIDAAQGDSSLPRFSGKMYMKLSDAFSDVYIQNPDDPEDVEQAIGYVRELFHSSGYSGDVNGFAKKMLVVQRAFPEEILSLEDAVVLYQRTKSYYAAAETMREDENDEEAPN